MHGTSNGSASNGTGLWGIGARADRAAKIFGPQGLEGLGNRNVSALRGCHRASSNDYDRWN